ncbi:hypothetical protein [Flavobacterium sp. S87F.05.LMB.W.Kidney.N]|uniref:hypothetical protein n=1 Tax=Flavobacterium sp. S87F.05.LMB.W.Kidney.N TaxID=1278758 RepID=UPI00106647E0|nr:hypothetical protein [Flavobacterium sp. S87F.05.LMB.W.Kidney.N]TDX11465.1 RelA/SpoT family protein [Flavobacterium sp. S87F.05.LMB.W.Kidney.N]
MNRDLQLIEKDICSTICERLDKVGILYRIFSRVKDINSSMEKINRKKQQGEPYSENGKKMQDIIGVRIVTYFYDDVNLVKKILSDIFDYVDDEIDDIELTVFKPKRTNIIYSFSKGQKEIFDGVINITKNEILLLSDSTFELQLRTILSEGWHEIDHSLRYKTKGDWINHSEKERLLNGIYANLEVNDLAMKSLFNELAYQHFKQKKWEAMLRNKYRLKFHFSIIREDLRKILDEDNTLAKQIFKADRASIVDKLSKIEIPLPINFNNIIFFINHVYIKNDKISQLTPDFIKSNI